MALYSDVVVARPPSPLKETPADAAASTVVGPDNAGVPSQMKLSVVSEIRITLFTIPRVTSQMRVVFSKIQKISSGLLLSPSEKCVDVSRRYPVKTGSVI